MPGVGIGAFGRQVKAPALPDAMLKHGAERSQSEPQGLLFVGHCVVQEGQRRLDHTLREAEAAQKGLTRARVWAAQAKQVPPPDSVSTSRMNEFSLSPFGQYTMSP